MSRKPRSKGLLNDVRDTIRRKQYSIRTEEAYVHWIKRFILFHDRRAQNRALNALLFLSREVLGIALDATINAVRAKRPERLPTVPTREGVRKVLAYLPGRNKRLYGRGACG